VHACSYTSKLDVAEIAYSDPIACVPTRPHEIGGASRPQPPHVLRLHSRMHARTHCMLHGILYEPHHALIERPCHQGSVLVRKGREHWRIDT
jgi:hypothetical protein